jgi:hypothetical protein
VITMYWIKPKMSPPELSIILYAKYKM